MQATVERLPASFKRTYKNSSDDKKSRSGWFNNIEILSAFISINLIMLFFQLGVYKPRIRS